MSGLRWSHWDITEEAWSKFYRFYSQALADHVNVTRQVTITPLYQAVCRLIAIDNPPANWVLA